MPKYQVLVTGCTYVEVEADNCDNAEAEAGKVLEDMRFGIWDMELDFTCDEDDLLDEEEENATTK
jgi:hypothetical protein